jgi:hypothetical protein
MEVTHRRGVGCDVGLAHSEHVRDENVCLLLIRRLTVFGDIGRVRLSTRGIIVLTAQAGQFLIILSFGRSQPPGKFVASASKKECRAIVVVILPL